MEISVGRPKSRRTLVGLALASSLIGPVWADTFTGPVGKYYLDNLSNSTIYVVQGTSVVESFPMAYSSAYGEGVLAVSETIRTRARYLAGGDLAAGEYTLLGNPTGHSYSTPLIPYSAFSVYDGTSDGTYNYFVDHNGGMGDQPGNGGVYRTDYYWQDPELLFYPRFLCPEYQFGCQGVSGISYDPTNNSLWISSKPDTWIADYSLSGVLLAAFDTRIWDYRIYPPGFAGYNAALALDPADHTLWLTSGGTNLLRQYSLDRATFGDLLQMGTPSGLPGASSCEYCGPFVNAPYYESGEFRDAAPEPATFVLLLPVIAVIGFRIRSHARLSS